MASFVTILSVKKSRKNPTAPMPPPATIVMNAARPPARFQKTPTMNTAVIGGANLAGGIGTAFGALVGSALIEVIRNSLGLLGINAFWQGTFIGGAIILAVMFDRIRNLRQSE